MPSINTRNPDNDPITSPIVSRLRRDLGTVESYAALIGILIGAGIFKVTSDAWKLAGPSVILGLAEFRWACACCWAFQFSFLSFPDCSRFTRRTTHHSLHTV